MFFNFSVVTIVLFPSTGDRTVAEPSSQRHILLLVLLEAEEQSIRLSALEGIL